MHAKWQDSDTVEIRGANQLGRPSNFRDAIRQFITSRGGRFVIGTLGTWLIAAGALDLYGQKMPPRGERWDAIVVAGCRVLPNGTPSVALTRRTMLAVRLWKEGYAPKIVFTGGVGESRRSEAATAAGLARAHGVPAQATVIEDRSTSTEENARFAREAIGDQRVLVVTDSFHAFRARRVFSRHFREAAAAGSTGKPWPRARGAIREVGAIMYYGIRGRL